jgi:hypothetical protein
VYALPDRLQGLPVDRYEHLMVHKMDLRKYVFNVYAVGGQAPASWEETFNLEAVDIVEAATLAKAQADKWGGRVEGLALIEEVSEPAPVDK